MNPVPSYSTIPSSTSVGHDLRLAREATDDGSYREALTHLMDVRDRVVTAEPDADELTAFQMFANVDRFLDEARQAVATDRDPSVELSRAADQLSYTAATVGFVN